MKLFTTLIQRVTALMVVLVMALGLNAADRTFATIADMHADTTLKAGDKVTITEDVVFNYSIQYYFVVSDKNGTASVMNNYCYYINKIVENNSLKAGDVLKNYSGTISINSSGVYRLEPEVITKSGSENFGGDIVIESKSDAYTIKTTKVTIKDLLDNPALYDGKIVSLDMAETKNATFSSYLIQGTDTLKSFTITGLDNDAYPKELAIDRALFRVDMNGNGSLAMTQNDFDVTFKSVKSFKTTSLTENIEIDLTVQVLKKEVYDGKTYLTVFESEGDKLVDCAGLRILLNTENAEDKKIKVGDIVNIKTATAKYQKNSKTGLYFTHSLVTLDTHETSILENRAIAYYVIPPEEIIYLDDFEFLPVTIAAELTFTGKENAAHKDKNFAQAILGEEVKVYVDITKKPANITDKFYLNGLLEIPLWQTKSMNSYIIPLSSDDFFNNVKEFDNISAAIAAGTPINSVVKYKINSDMTIIGIDSIVAVGEEDRNQYVVFVKDATASLMLFGRIDEDFQVGDVVTSVVGEYKSCRNSITTSAGVHVFGVANSLTLDAVVIESGEKVVPVVPKKVTIAELLNDDNLASQVVLISDFTHKVVTEVIQTITIDRHYIYQDGDSIIVDESFADIEKGESIIAIYYLNDFYSRLLPYVGKLSEDSEDVGLDNNFAVDKALFVVDNTICAQGAEIEIYDVMGRMVASGVDFVNVENVKQSVFVVRTKYSDGQVFVTKVANR